MDKRKTVFVSGANGQDGSWAIDYLLENTDCNIIGLVRHLSSKNWKNIEHNIGNPRLKIEEADLTDALAIEDLIRNSKPDYFINFAASSFVGNSWGNGSHCLDVNTMGVLYILEAIRKFSPHTRFYQSGSSEMWGDVIYSPQNYEHPFRPRSVYGVSKCASHYLTKVFRESYNLFAISGILLNHESERRGHDFVTRKITLGVARIKKAIERGEKFEPILLGNINAKRDWSHALDFVAGIWKMLNQETPKEYVLSSNETHTIREFVEKAFAAAGIKEAVWDGEALEEKYTLPEYLCEMGELKSFDLVKISPEFFRPNEVETLWGDSTPARTELGWTPKISFSDLISMMVKNDIENP